MFRERGRELCVPPSLSLFLLVFSVFWLYPVVRMRLLLSLRPFKIQDMPRSNSPGEATALTMPFKIQDMPRSNNKSEATALTKAL